MSNVYVVKVGSTEAAKIATQKAKADSIVAKDLALAAQAGAEIAQAAAEAAEESAAAAAASAILVGDQVTNHINTASGAHASSAISFLQEGTGTVTRTAQSKLRDRISVLDFGADPTGATESTVAVNAGIVATAALGKALYFPTGTYLCGTINVITNMSLIGESSTTTIIKAKNGLNATLLSSGGAVNRDDVYLQSLRFDGNKANNTSGTTIQLHGHRPTIKDIVVVNSAGKGIDTNYTVSSRLTGGLGYFERIVIDSPAETGWDFNGPNDSSFNGVEIIDAGVKTDNAFYGINVASSARFNDLHHWNRDATTNVAIAGVLVAVSGCNFVNCHFEGGKVPLLINANANTFESSHYYAPRGTYCVSLNGVGNILKGIMGGGYASANPNYAGLDLNQGYNVIELIEGNCALGTIDFTNSAGGNSVRLFGYKTAAPAYVGSPVASDDVVINMAGPGGATLRHHYPV